MTVLDRAIATLLPWCPKAVVRQISRRYIAGETAEDALRVATRLNALGFRATMDLLGEHVTTVEDARNAAHQYMELLDQIHGRGIQSTISLKLSHFGLKIDKPTCLALVHSVVSRAAELGNFVRLDMEDSSCTTDTLDVFRSLRQHHNNVGCVLQAYLKRTESDIERMRDLRSNIRLCKGVYVEAPEVAYRDMSEINTNYIRQLEVLLRRGNYVGIATHDERLVQEAITFIRELQLPASAYEFQMLLGVREPLRDRIQTAGHPVRIYIPFGSDWYAYSVRRLRENPRLAGYVLKAMFSRK